MNALEKRRFALKRIQKALDEVAGDQPEEKLFSRFRIWEESVRSALEILVDEQTLIEWRTLISEISWNTVGVREWEAKNYLRCRGIVNWLLSLHEVLMATTISPPETGTSMRPQIPKPDGDRVFLGHGRSPLWRELKDFLHEELNVKWEEFNREPTAGIHTAERLQQMLDRACFAFIVMTAEDEHADGTKHARGNVIHEAGLFQGRLGFRKAIVLMEEGCTEFSNIAGLTQIRFPKGQILAKSEEIRGALKREGII
jgi:hypothetical protein